ncbi:MAG: hypothetical protein RIC03_03150 [Cyclobacteriaceae bacterium]
MTIQASVSKYVEDYKEYHRTWIFDEPLVIKKSYHEDLLKLQKIMYKLITHFVNNYDSFKSLMPVNERIEEVLKIVSEKPYRPGTYRTDFVFDSHLKPRIIEITCRFGMNGIFLSSLINNISQEYKASKCPQLLTSDPYEGIYSYLEKYLENKQRIYVIVGADIKNESRIFQPIFERIGLPVYKINYRDLSQYLDQMENAFVISELGFDEILSLHDETIAQLSKVGVFNDLRTVFLIHDKRFFSVIGNERLQNAVLDQAEKEHFSKFYIPTYSHSERPDLWADALLNKDHWILKHKSLGKSQQIYAGVTLNNTDWQELFVALDLEEYVLQEWIHQKTMKGTIKGVPFNDYVTGTLLFFDDNYFGFGDFRTSSYQVINKVDHRKMTSLILENDTIPSEYNFTNIIG